MFSCPFITVFCAFVIFAALPAAAQQSAQTRAGVRSRGGQDLSTMGEPGPPANHAPQGFAAERLARERRQAQLNQNFPGTALLPPLARTSRAVGQGGRRNGAL